MRGFENSHRPDHKPAEKSQPRSTNESQLAESRDETWLWREVGAIGPLGSSAEAASIAFDHRGPGQAADAAIASAVGAHTGTDLRGVRVHADPVSQRATGAMRARAFAYRHEVFLGPGESPTDTALVAHELAHVAQQRGGTTPQRKAEGGEGRAAEAEADSVAADVVSGAAPPDLLVDAGPLAPGQMLKQPFLDALKPHVVKAADEELGPVGSALGCPFIARYFEKYSALPAAASQALVRRWAPAAKEVRSASELVPLILERVRAGVRAWKATGALPRELAAAEPVEPARATSAPPSPEEPRRKSLDGIEAELGPGQRADARLSAAVGANGARIHRGAEAARQAREHGAVAFTVGEDVVMGADAPPPGTLAGDALLAHELAHAAQQRDAARDRIRRRQPIGVEDPAAEGAAVRAAASAMAGDARLDAFGNVTGPLDGHVMRTGLQLQRCATWEESPDLQRQLGLSIAIDPAPPEGKAYVVGQKLKLSIAQEVPSEHMVMVYHWAAIDARGNELRAQGEPPVTFQIFWPGTMTLRAAVGVNVGGNTIATTVLERKVEAVRATTRAEELVAKAGVPVDFASFRASQDINVALLSPENKPLSDQVLIVRSMGPNPAQQGTSSIPLGISYAPDVTEPAGRTYHWYAYPLQAKDMPGKLGASPKVSVEGRDAYDLGTGRGATLATEQKGVFVVTCQAFDGGVKAAEAAWVQSILNAKELEAVADLKEQLADLDVKVGHFTKNAKGDPDLVPVTAIHVDAATGAETQLSMFIGKRTDGDLGMLNATPGLKLSEHRVEFIGSSTGAVLDNFDSHNKYPAGAIRFHVPGDAARGIAAADRTIVTSGETRLGGIASALGFAALVLSVAAIPFTGGTSATATVLLLGASATGIAAGAFSLADHLSNEKFTKTSVALDCLQIAASTVDLGFAAKALRSSPALVVANRAARYALWGSLGIQGVSAFLISVEAIGQIEKIMADEGMSRSQKISALTRLFATLIVTGALLVLSYRSLGEAKARMSDVFGAKGRALKDLDAAALGLVDETVLRTLRAAEQDELERLAAMIRKDPALVTRLPNRRNVLGALKGCRTTEPSELEMRLFQQRLTESGASGRTAKRITDALTAASVDPATAHLLTDADLGRVRNADEALARARGKRDDDPTKAQALASARSEMDGVTGVTPRARDEIRAGLAHFHGMPDPAFVADPLAALRTRFPRIPPADMELVGKLDRDALLALESATENDVRRVIARLKSGSGADVSDLLRSFYYKERKPTRKEGEVYVPPARVGERLEAALENAARAQARGYPYGFASKPDFDKFMAAVKSALTKRGIPAGDVRIHGSAVHDPQPRDVDVAVLVDGATFDRLGETFKARAPNRSKLKDVEIDLRKGKISSANFYPDVDPPAALEVSKTGTALNAQVSIVRRGSEFDLGPYVPK